MAGCVLCLSAQSTNTTQSNNTSDTVTGSLGNPGDVDTNTPPPTITQNTPSVCADLYTHKDRKCVGNFSRAPLSVLRGGRRTARPPPGCCQPTTRGTRGTGWREKKNGLLCVCECVVVFFVFFLKKSSV